MSSNAIDLADLIEADDPAFARLDRFFQIACEAFGEEVVTVLVSRPPNKACLQIYAQKKGQANAK